MAFYLENSIFKHLFYHLSIIVFKFICSTLTLFFLKKKHINASRDGKKYYL